MKPNFALSLSFEGIRLLHRAAGGWRILGDVDLEARDLGAAFAALKNKAETLDPAGLRSKVLLPPEQIKFLTIDTPGMDEAARRNAAALALDGATPYAVPDLAFDISIEGDRTHVAAVARETLAEAEGFAAQYGFNPVSFAAVPGDNAYLGEPFFGVTKGASDLIAPGDIVEPDGIAVVVIGTVDAAPPPEPAPPITVAPPPAPLPPQAPAAPQVPTLPDAAPTVGFASRRRSEPQVAPDVGGVTRAPPPSQAEPVAFGAGTITADRIAVEPDQPASPPAPPQPTAPPPAPKRGLLGRRKPAAVPVAAGTTIPAAPPPVTMTEGTEKERMTVFGARASEVGGKPRFLGLMLTAALLILLAGVAAWASVYLDDGQRLSRLLGVAEEKPTFAEAAALDLPKPEAAPEEVRTASLDPVLSEEDSAVLDALRQPDVPQAPPVMSAAEVQARYAATGIWPAAPAVPETPANPLGLDGLYVTGIDPVSTALDAVALPALAAYDTDASLAMVVSPAAAGTAFDFDENGLVIPTAQGALAPGGFTVILGRPALVPPATPTRFLAEPQDTAIRSALAAARPQPRPADLAENRERAALGGLTRSELGQVRPSLRPAAVSERAAAQAAARAAAQAQAEAEAEAEAQAQRETAEAANGAVALALATPSAFEDATENAVVASIRPDTRPRNFARTVQRAQRNREAEAQDDVRVASAAAIAPRVVTPKIPSRTSVAKQATVRNAINLRKINLIGVYGKPASRRALVRLSNGRYRKVEVGDRIDGGRVSAISNDELRYVKRGKNLVLKMPR